MAMTAQEMSQLVYKWELEAGESFYEYSSLLSEPRQVLDLVDILERKGLLEEDMIEDIRSDAFPEIITLVSSSKAFNSGVHEDYMILLDNINAFIMQDQKEYMTFVKHYVNGMDPRKSQVFKDYMKKGEEYQ